ncbi:hypothetical protein ZWY2020_011133 [Hordeum vulgare]|nr:hypothetical protein ZWY2020_011133 [Hordeum vulgare]
MHFDGAFTCMGSGARVVLTSSMGDKLRYTVQLCFQRGEKVSNNIAEYEGLIADLNAATTLRIWRLAMMGDSQLLIKFSNKEYKPMDEHMEVLKSQASSRSDSASLPRKRHPRAQCHEERSSPQRCPQGLRIQPSRARLFLALEAQADDSMQELGAYLPHGTLLEKEEDAERVAQQASTYCLRDDNLYRRRVNDVALRCISREEGRELLAYIHEGDYGNHPFSRMLAGKAFRSGIYWPIALDDAPELVRSCEACQFHAKQIH